MNTKSGQWLLRLRPCLQQETTSRAWQRQDIYVTFKPSPYPRASRQYAQTTKPGSRPPQPSRPKQPSRSAPPKPQTACPPPKESLPPPPLQPSSSTFPSANARNAYASQLLNSSSQVLLYHAPPHRGFIITSVVTGAIIILGSVNFFSFALAGRPDETTGNPAPVPWHVKALTLVPSVAMAVMGTTFLIAPARLVRAVALVSRTEAANVGNSSRTPAAPMLKFYMRPSFPYLFRGGRSFEVNPADVKLDLQVKATVPPDMKSFSIHEGQHFPSEFLEKGSTKMRRGLMERLRNAGPALVHDVRRMFLRDSIAYMEIKDQGLWKLDLHHAFVLDEAKPLRKLMRMDSNIDRSIFGKVRALIS